MNTADDDLTSPPGETVHITPFDPSKPSLLGVAGAPSSGSLLQMFSTAGWLPTILFDAICTSAVLHHFCTETQGGIIVFHEQLRLEKGRRSAVQRHERHLVSASIIGTLSTYAQRVLCLSAALFHFSTVYNFR